MVGTRSAKQRFQTPAVSRFSFSVSRLPLIPFSSGLGFRLRPISREAERTVAASQSLFLQGWVSDVGQAAGGWDAGVRLSQSLSLQGWVSDQGIHQ